MSGRGALSHVDAHGRVQMVDVGDKVVTDRQAIAGGEITMSAAARQAIRSGTVAKGDPLQAARLAGIMAAKQTAALIPLCHPLPLVHVGVDLAATRQGYRITARVRTASRTGVEMEALTAVSVAALTIYDMLKAVDSSMVIGHIRLLEKTGGTSHPRSGVQAQATRTVDRRGTVANVTGGTGTGGRRRPAEPGETGAEPRRARARRAPGRPR